MCLGHWATQHCSAFRLDCHIHGPQATLMLRKCEPGFRMASWGLAPKTGHSESIHTSRFTHAPFTWMRRGLNRWIVETLNWLGEHVPCILFEATRQDKMLEEGF